MCSVCFFKKGGWFPINEFKMEDKEDVTKKVEKQKIENPTHRFEVLAHLSDCLYILPQVNSKFSKIVRCF